MKIIIISTLLALAAAKVVNKISRCEGVNVNGIDHEKEVIQDYVDKPYMMSIDYDTNVLLYTYTGVHGSSFKAAALNLKTKETYIITGVPGSFATSVDPTSHKAYIGGSDGIYEFDYQSKTTKNLNITGHNIWQVFANDGIYFTTYPDELAFVYKNGILKRVAGSDVSKAMLVGVDNDNNIFFSNSSGLFLQPKEKDDFVSVGDYTVNSFTTDVNGNLYFTTPTGIFSLGKVTNHDLKITKLAGINNIYGAVVEMDGSLIYGASNSIIRLKSTGKECHDQY